MSVCIKSLIKNINIVVGCTIAVSYTHLDVYKRQKITTQKLDNDLTMFGDKLSKTFNGITMS